ncbi:hypothetical protein DFP72DRAFT_1141339 [Ephemerocybe angulata]|uniref:F-box domain-containing protein n=1 Tax=Ephemerocybe angulata TaxID=980116 RepID=A0A8H6MFJ4_9AGAR|nr:hypothetical protein DFP72DRAFT_1141339 [Tulosesus angulatus]
MSKMLSIVIGFVQKFVSLHSPDDQESSLSNCRAPHGGIRSLPDELLEIIFDHTLALSTDRHLSLNRRIMQVCHQWRDLALHSPPLWSTLPDVSWDTFAVSGPSHTAMNTKRDAVLLYLERSRAHPITFTLHIDNWHPTTDTRVREESERLFEVLVSHSHRWANADLDVPFRLLRIHSDSIKGRLPQLKFLSLKVPWPFMARALFRGTSTDLIANGPAPVLYLFSVEVPLESNVPPFPLSTNNHNNDNVIYRINRNDDRRRIGAADGKERSPDASSSRPFEDLNIPIEGHPTTPYRRQDQRRDEKGRAAGEHRCHESDLVISKYHEPRQPRRLTSIAATLPRPQTVNSPPFSSTSLRIRRLLPNAVPPTIAHAQPRRSVPQIVPTRTHRELHLVGLCSHCTIPTATPIVTQPTHTFACPRCAATLPADPRAQIRLIAPPLRYRARYDMDGDEMGSGLDDYAVLGTDESTLHYPLAACPVAGQPSSSTPPTMESAQTPSKKNSPLSSQQLVGIVTLSTIPNTSNSRRRCKARGRRMLIAVDVEVKSRLAGVFAVVVAAAG